MLSQQMPAVGADRRKHTANSAEVQNFVITSNVLEFMNVVKKCKVQYLRDENFSVRVKDDKAILRELQRDGGGEI